MAYPKNSNRQANRYNNQGYVKRSNQTGSIPPNRAVAIVLAFFLGSFGIHKFYLGRNVAGVLSLLFFWTGIPWIVSVIDFFRLLFMSDNDFRSRYWRYELGPDEDAVLDANKFGQTNQHEAAPLNTKYSAEESLRFVQLVHAANEASKSTSFSFVDSSGVAKPIVFLSNSLPMDGVMLPTVTMQTDSISLLFTPKQVVAKKGGSIKILTYKEITVGLSLGTTSNTKGEIKTPTTGRVYQAINVLFAGDSKIDTSLRKVFAEADKLFAPQEDKTQQVIDVTFEREDQLSLRLPNGSTFLLQHDQPSALVAIQEALKEMQR